MADYLTDEEQLQVLKNWWKKNGISLLLIIVIAVSGYFGWQTWNRHQQKYAEQASVLYGEIMDSSALPAGEILGDDQYTSVRFLIKQMQDEYRRSFYALGASLLAAKLAVDKGDLAVAEQELLLAQKLADKDIRPIVSLRLARVYLARDKLDEALKLARYDADAGDSDPFTGLFAVLRGDILAARGELQAARAAWQTALDTLDESSRLQRQLVEIKLSDLMGGDPS